MLMALLMKTFIMLGQTMELSGVVTDGKKGVPLSDVRIIINKEIIERTNTKGEFRVSVNNSINVRFWKSGYFFLTFQLDSISDKKNMKIKLFESRPAKFSRGIIEEAEEIKYKGVILDGVALPEEDWKDINAKEIKEIGIRQTKEGAILIYTTE